MSSNTASSRPTPCDVLIVGGGPAGSTLATLLAERGRDVVLLEKAHHPRFHIGESLLPMNLPILETLGVLDQVKEIGIVKYGAEFNSDKHSNQHQTYYFSRAMDKKAPPHAYEVKRCEFDHLLLKNSVEKGARVHEGMKVTDVQFNPGAPSLVSAEDDEGKTHHWATRFVVDASGRDTLLSKRFDLKKKNPEHNSAALFGHFENVVRRKGKDEGNISVYWFEHGWFWMIPLKDGTMSVGAVCFPEYLKTRQGSTEDFLWQTIALSAAASERMKDAKLVSEVRATGNFSYTSERSYGDGYLLIGDAFAFVDPVFSSGVYLAMTGATLAVDVVQTCLDQPAQADKALAEFEQRMRKGISIFSWFIYRFNTPSMRNLFMSPKNFMRIEEAVTSLLAGDLFRKTPISLPIAIFKVVYYATFAANFRRARAAYKRRLENAKILFTGGTTPQDPH